jgi:hypothetical protein
MELFYPLFELLGWVFLPWITFILTCSVLLTLSDWLKTKMEYEVTEVATSTGN